jgi:hypothetical protein
MSNQATMHQPEPLTTFEIPYTFHLVRVSTSGQAEWHLDTGILTSLTAYFHNTYFNGYGLPNNGSALS